MNMTIRDIARLRLRNQGIVAATSKRPLDVVRALGAIQAQDYLGALWAVGLRMRTASEAAIEKALADGRIVRTWPMRGTLHFVAAEDVRWMLPLLAPRVVVRTAGRHRQLGLEPSLFPRCAKVIRAALRGGNRLTREQAYGVLEAAGISTAGQRGIHILQQMAHEGLICFGPRSGKKQTFVLLDEWVPAVALPGREEALANLARRYFAGHGPATVRDFAWWTGLTATEAKKGLASVKGDLQAVDAEGTEYWMARGAAGSADGHPAAFLLPAFDEYLVAYKDRRAAVDPRHARALHSLLSPTLVLNGRVVGTWTRTLKPGKVAITPRLLAKLGAKDSEALEAAARRYADFLGLDYAWK